MNDLLITRTKILLPSRRPGVLSRRRLLDLFAELLEHRLIVLGAPAGYGKTTLLIDLAHHVDLPVCWYALDPLDADPHHFTQHLIEAVAQRFSEFGKVSRSVLAGMGIEPDWNRLAKVVANDAYEHVGERFILVLDDYHFVNASPEVNIFVNQLLHSADENWHLVISSRDVPTLPDLPLFVARSQVNGLDDRALAFEADEIQALILQNYNLTITEEDAEALVQETEGWITGLLLSAQTMAVGLADRVRIARASGVGLYDYLAQQVLDQQPQPLKTFLLQTALLKEFDAGLCEAVLGAGSQWKRADWQELINEVVKRNLFVQPVGSGTERVRYHQLFQEFLESKMIQDDPSRSEQIRRRLAAVYAEQGEWEKAYVLFEQLQDTEALADLIERAGQALIYGARQSTLARWIDALPFEVMHSRPRVISLRGTVAADVGDVEQAVALLNEAEEKARAARDDFCLARTLVRRAGAYRFAGEYDVSFEDSEEALQVLEGIESDLTTGTVQGAALRAKGFALYRLGRLQEAIEVLEEAKECYGSSNNTTTIALVENDLGMACRALGDYEEARRHYLWALDHWRMENNIRREAHVLNNLGVLNHYLGEYEQAGSFLDQAVQRARQSGSARTEAFGLTSIGDLYCDLEAYEAAGRAYALAADTMLPDSLGFLRSYLGIVRARVSRLQSDLEGAREFLAQAALNLSTQPSYESGLYHLEVGRLAAANKEFDEATRHLKQAVQAFEAGGHAVEQAAVHLSLATVYESTEKRADTVTVLQYVFRTASSLRDKQSLIVAAREAKSCLESLQSDAQVGREATNLSLQITHFETEIPHLRRRLRRRMTVVPFSPPRLVIRAFDKEQVEIEGRLIAKSDWQSPKAPILLFLLLAYPSGLTKEEIGVHLWPDHEPEKFKGNFQKTIYRLRRATKQNIVLYNEETERYSFNWQLDYWYDVIAFRKALDQAKTEGEAAAQISAYRAALELYDGSYLPHIEGLWVWPLRQSLDGLFREASLQAAKLCLVGGEYEKTIHICRRLLTEDRSCEDAHRLLMRAHAAKGNIAAVKRQFADCQDVLRRDLQVAPSPRTIELYEMLTHAIRL